MKARGECSPFFPSTLFLCAEKYPRFIDSGREKRNNKLHVGISDSDFALVFVQHLSKKELSLVLVLDPGTISIFNAVYFM